MNQQSHAPRAPYETPRMELILLSGADIITTSDPNGGADTLEPDWGLNVH